MNIKKLGYFFLVVMLSTGWIFSGWAQIFGFPPRIQKVYAATITFVGSAEASGNSASYNVDLTTLSLQEGDLVIVSTGFVGTADGDPGVSTSGYTEVADLYANDTADANFSVNWKIMGASPDTSVTCLGSGSATNGAVCEVHAWRGVNQTTPLDVTSTTATGINASPPDSPTITPVTSGAIVIATGLGVSVAVDDTVTAPTGYGNQADISVDPGNASTVGIASKAWSGSGAEDPAVWTNWTTALAASWGAATLALRPAPSFTQSVYRFFNNADSTDVGSTLAAQDTVAALGSTGAAFRLRMLLHVGTSQLDTSGQSFKLQFAAQSGTCDTAFSGETYADVTATTVIAYNNNATPADGATLTANASDPTHNADTIVNQTYEELNNFTNSVAAIPSGQDGKWDFALIDNGATASTAYCLRVVNSNATVIDTYTVIPQITMASASSQSLTFSISDSSIGFGTLSASAAGYATGDTLGSAADTVDAHTLSVSTNATSGYALTVNGATLTRDLFTITAIGATAAASSPGTEQFGMRLIVNSGTGATTAPYNTANWALDTGAFPDQVGSGSGDGSTTVFGVRYIANISAPTEAGSYSTTLTYVATATF